MTSIDETLARILAASEAAAASLATLVARTGSGPPTADAPAPPPEAPKRPGRPPKPKPEAPATAPPPEPIDSAADFLSDVSPPPTRDDVRAWLVKLGKAWQNPEKGRPLLKQFGGVDTVGALPEAKFAAVIEACQKAMPATA